MTNEAEKIVVTQEARDLASEIVRWGAPGVGNGNTIAAAEIKGGLHDDYLIVQEITKALAAAERRGLERAAEVCEEYAKEIEGFHNVAPGFVREAATHIRKLAGGTDD